MSGRIRGHYRIDAAGRVEPISDVNASLAKCVCTSPPRRDPVAERRSRLGKICMVGLGLFCLGLALMASLPEIQHVIVATENAHMALIRKTYLQAHPGLTPAATGHHWHYPMGED